MQEEAKRAKQSLMEQSQKANEATRQLEDEKLKSGWKDDQLKELQEETENLRETLIKSTESSAQEIAFLKDRQNTMQSNKSKSEETEKELHRQLQVVGCVTWASSIEDEVEAKLCVGCIRWLTCG